jgi:hypothetical protein
MERIESSTCAEATTIEVDTASITLRLPRGAAVFVVRGEAWLTQDGRLDDFILAPGSRFDVEGDAPIVVSATRDRATLHVTRPVGACRRAALDLYDYTRGQAQALRRAEMSRLAGALTGLARAWLARAHAALGSRTRLTTH